MTAMLPTVLTPEQFLTLDNFEDAVRYTSSNYVEAQAFQKSNFWSLVPPVLCLITE